MKISRNWFGFGIALASAGVLFIVLNWAPDRPVQGLAAQWAKPPSQFIVVKGLSIHVRDEGPRSDATPIVLIHGTAASLHTWEGWVAALKGQRRVITMDLPGFGLTGPNAQSDYRSQTYTTFILDLLDALGVQRCVLGGNSLGGDIAWQVAVHAPQRVAQLILVDSAGYPMQAESMPIGFIMARLPLINRVMDWTLPRALVAASIRNVYGDPTRVTPALVDRYEALMLRAGNRHALSERFSQSNFGAHAAQIKTIKQPTLILWGGRDRLIPVSDARQFQRDIADSTLVIFEDLGHVPQEEAPQRTVAAVQTFLTSPHTR